MSAKIISLEETIAWRQKLKGKQKIVVTNGVYDLLHPGHIDYQTNAKNQGDLLLVCCNGDKGVHELKGPKRPIINEDNRAYMLASLECVDKVVLFPEMEALDTLVAVEPDIYVKGGDYTIDTINQSERRALEKLGTEIRILPFRDGFSTTLMIEKIIDVYG